MQAGVHEPVLDGLVSAIKYDRTYFDKIVASVGPLMEKLTSGKVAELISPDYFDLEDPRPLFDWLQVIRKRGIVYVGLDALSDPTVAAAVGNSMFADLDQRRRAALQARARPRPARAAGGEPTPRIAVHADEFNELIGEEFVPAPQQGRRGGLPGHLLHPDLVGCRGEAREPRKGRTGRRATSTPSSCSGCSTRRPRRC